MEKYLTDPVFWVISVVAVGALIVTLALISVEVIGRGMVRGEELKERRRQEQNRYGRRGP